MSLRISASIPILAINNSDQMIGGPRLIVHSSLSDEVVLEIEGNRYRVNVNELRSACVAATTTTYKYAGGA